MNLGLRKRHISSEAVPAISTRPEIEPIRSQTAGDSVGRSRGRRGGQVVADALESHATGGLDQHDVAGPNQPRDDGRGLSCVGGHVRAITRPVALGDCLRQRPNSDQNVDPARRASICRAHGER